MSRHHDPVGHEPYRPSRSENGSEILRKRHGDPMAEASSGSTGSSSGSTGSRESAVSAHEGAQTAPLSAPPDDDILGVAASWLREGREVALATVVTTWGSSPRPVGSQLAVNDTGHFVGSVSAGCVEGAVVEAARETLKTGQPRLLDFGIADDQAWEVGLSCGGKIEIFVEKIG